jgi:hypothetical protein
MKRVLPSIRLTRQNPWGRTFILPLILLFFFQVAHAQFSISFNIDEPDCFGLPNGNLTAVPVGGTAPFIYNWDTGDSGQTLTGINSGTYSVTVTDATFTQVTQSVFVGQPDLVTVTFNADVCQVPFTVTVFGGGGVGPYTYNWSTGQSTATISNLPEGTYCITLTDQNGCGAVDCITLEGTPLSVGVVANSVNCFNGSDGSIAAFPSGGTPPYSYLWSNGGVGQVIGGLPSGAYSVTLTDANGCTANATGFVNNAPQLLLNPNAVSPVCPGDTNGSITLGVSGGNPPYAYSWSTGQSTSFLSNLGPGTYSVTVLDVNNCPATTQVTLNYLSNLTVGALGTPETCEDFNDGFLTADVSGGVQPYTYSWNNGANTQVVTNVVPGIYSVVVTDAVGCTGTATATVNPAADFDISLTGSDVSTCGASDGVATANILAGFGPFAFVWNTGETTASISGLGGGLFSVTVTNGFNCIETGSVFIAIPPDISVDIDATPTVCEGETDGSAIAVVTGGTPPFSYIWNTGANTQSITNLGAGTYSVVVTDANGCQDAASATIIEVPELNVVVNATEIICGTEDTGSANVTVGGGLPPYTYMWSTGSSQTFVEDLEDGTYSVVVTDANGCTGFAEFAISIIDDFAISVVPRDVLCFGGNDGSILVTASGGTGPYTYAWNNGMSGMEIIDLTVGSYTVTVTEGNDCVIVETIVINQPPLLTIGVTGSNPDCFGGSSGTTSAFANGGTMPYTFTWSNEEDTPGLIDIPAGTYSVTVTDANFCTAVGSVTLVAPLEMDITVSAPIIDCAGTASGTATAIPTGGTLPYSYIWSNGGNTQMISDISAGIYGVTVTDAAGCQVSSSTISIQELPQIDINFDVTDISCSDQNIGIISTMVTGGSGPYTYFWNNGLTASTITGLAPGTYTVTVTDDNGCEGVAMATVNATPNLSVGATSTNITCAGFNDGIATAIVSGGTAPFSYSWNTGADTETITGLSPGTYTIMVTDVNECTGMASVTITAPPAMSLQTSSVDVTCAGGSDGSASVTAMGGTAPYAYLWSSGSTTPQATGLAIGSYTIEVTDANGCVASAVVAINQPPAVSVSITGATLTCEGSSTGTAIAVASGGTPPYSYSWSTGAVTASVSNLAAGMHSVVVTDANGCTGMSSVTINNFPQPICSVSIIQEALNGNDGILEVFPVGGTAPYTYLWSDGQTTPTAAGLSGGTYSVTVTDANGCTTTCEETLFPWAGIGNYVWEDIDKDGIQDANEPGVEGVVVNLKDASGTVIATTTTDANGFYNFLGLVPGEYSVQFIVEYPMVFTLVNQGSDDELDSDADDSTMGMTINTILTDGEIDYSWDAGIYVMPTVNGTDPCFCLNNSTTEEDGQFAEEITIFSYPGETWYLVDPVNLYLESSPAPPADPIPAITGMEFVEVAPGVYVLHFKLIDAMQYSSSFSNGIDIISMSNVCEYPTINVNELPPANLCIWDDDYIFQADPNTPGELYYYLNGVPVGGLNLLELGVGDFELLVQLVPFDPEECEATILVEFTLVDDCSAKLGDYVWLDSDVDGIQDPDEVGIPGVQVIVTGEDEAENDFMETTYTDNTGMYMFLVPPGTYKVTFVAPPNLMPSPHNAGSDDTVDSDMDPVTFMTHVVTLEPNQMDLTLDAGFYSLCENITDPGEVGPNQYVCGPGVDPDPILSLVDASGGQGVLEYLWMYSNEPGPFNPQIWLPVPDSDVASYDPGPLFVTTYYARCARRVGCSTFIETSNVITIEVGSEAVAEISGPSYICEAAPTTYTATGNGVDAVIEWNFGLGAVPMTATGTQVEVTFPSFGNFTIQLSVTENGCTSVAYHEITVSNDPVLCGGALAIDASIENEAERGVMVSWEMTTYSPDYVYEVQYSRDGENFDQIGVAIPDHVIGAVQYFEYYTNAPKFGHNYYRVNVVNSDTGDTMLSDVAQVAFVETSNLATVYPNPVTDELIVEIFNTYNEEVMIQLITATGMVIRSINVEEGVEAETVDFQTLPSGTYFLRLRYGKSDVKTIKVLKY